jgi:ankyrin repeat protein
MKSINFMLRDPRQGKSRSLYKAVVDRDLATIEKLTSCGVDPAYWEFCERDESLDACLSPLDVAIHRDWVEVVDLLLQCSPDPRGMKPRYLLSTLEFTIQQCHTKYFQIVLDALLAIVEKPSSLYGAMIAAANVGDVAVLKKLIEIGGNPNDNSDSEDGWTILMEAAYSGNLEIVKTLVENDASIDYNAFPRDADESAIRVAVWQENWDIIEYLLPFVKNKTDKAYAKRNLDKARGVKPSKKK